MDLFSEDIEDYASDYIEEDNSDKPSIFGLDSFGAEDEQNTPEEYYPENDNDLDTNTNVSTEGGIFQFAKELDAYQEQAENAQYSRALNKETDEEIEQRHEREEQKQRDKEAEDERKSENRKQALKDLGSDLVEAAKATGKGVKEVARIAYNLATGSSK